MEGGVVEHNFERDLPKDHPCQVWFNLVQRFQRRKFKCDLLSNMPIRSKSAGFIIRSLNACRMSIFPIFALLPNDEIIFTTLSNDEYLTRQKSSCMKSLTLLPLGKDKCDTRRQLLSGHLH